MDNTTVTVAYGDGIGPEIMEATLILLQRVTAAGLDFIKCESLCNFDVYKAR